MCHANAVFHLQQRGQQSLEIKMRHAVKIRLVAHIRSVEDRSKGVEWRVITKQLPAYFVIQQRSPVNQPKIPSVHVFEQALAPEFLKQWFVIVQRREVWNDRLVSDNEVAVIDGAVDGRLNALLEIGD